MKGQLTITFENELNAAMFEGTTSLFCRTDGYCIRDIVAKQRLLKFFHESTWSYWFRNGRFLLPKAIQSASKLKVSLKISG
jgi:hypothetical protein